jgi:glyoxylase-like metal-dependent hydrolase (beta-lactamase superfamily II)
VIVEKSMNRSYLSNSYLVGDRVGGQAVVIDTGGPLPPILEAIERHRLELTHVLCTHHHLDHVTHNSDFQQRFGCPVCAHPAEAALLRDVDLHLSDGDEIRSGELTIRALHVPGHTSGQLAFLVDDEAVFTGDTLFRRTVGGTRAPGASGFEDLQRSIMEVLMGLPRETVVYPGHMDETTILEEWEQNPFIRLWRGLDAPAERRCKVAGRPATLLLEAGDYDGGTKCWVRFDEGERLAIVGGSQVSV